MSVSILGAPRELDAVAAHRAAVEPLWTTPLLEGCGAWLPRLEEGSALVAEARCGAIPLYWSSRLPAAVRVIALEPSRAMLDQARARFDGLSNRRVFPLPQSIERLSYADGVFRAAVCLEGLETRVQMRAGLAELGRVVEPGGALVVAVPARETFAQIQEMIAEAAHLDGHRVEDALRDAVDDLLVDEDALHERALEIGLGEIEMQGVEWSVAFDSGLHALASPVVRGPLIAAWFSAIPIADRERVARRAADAIDTYFREVDFVAEARALCLRGVKAS